MVAGTNGKTVQQTLTVDITSPPPPPPPSDGSPPASHTLSGSVIDGTSGAGIPGVSIDAVNQSNFFPYSTTTDSNGDFRITLNDGTYKVTPMSTSGNDFNPSLQLVTISGANVTLEEPFVGTAPSAEITIFRSQANPVTFGQPVILEWRTRGTTSCSGDWTFQTLPIQGSYTVQPTAPGDLTYTLTCATSGDPISETITVRVQ